MPKPTVLFNDLPAPVRPSFVVPEAVADLQRSIDNRITQRAYQLFEESGRVPGRDMENWAQAEAYVLKSGLEIRECGSWLALSASLSGRSAESVRILVLPRRVIVATEDDAEFLYANLPAEIDPSTATASCKGGLRLMMKKCGGPAKTRLLSSELAS